MSEIQTLRKVEVCVDEELLRRLIEVCESAIETASSSLADISRRGLTEREKSRLILMYEADIALARQCRHELRDRLGFTEPAALENVSP